MVQFKKPFDTDTVMGFTLVNDLNYETQLCGNTGICIRLFVGCDLPAMLKYGPAVKKKKRSIMSLNLVRKAAFWLFLLKADCAATTESV